MTPENDFAEHSTKGPPSPLRKLSTTYSLPEDDTASATSPRSVKGLFSSLGSPASLVFRCENNSYPDSEFKLSNTNSRTSMKSDAASLGEASSDGQTFGSAGRNSSSFESEVPIVAVHGNIMVPLIDRPEEMKDLLSNGHNSQLQSLLKSALGPKNFDKAVKLWTEVPRRNGGSGRGSPNKDDKSGTINAMDDPEWLLETRRLLVSGLHGDKVLWHQWCNMVGWDDSISPDSDRDLAQTESTLAQERGSSLSLTAAADVIPEVEEE